MTEKYKSVKIPRIAYQLVKILDASLTIQGTQVLPEDLTNYFVQVFFRPPKIQLSDIITLSLIHFFNIMKHTISIDAISRIMDEDMRELLEEQGLIKDSPPKIQLKDRND